MAVGTCLATPQKAWADDGSACREESAAFGWFPDHTRLGPSLRAM